MSSESKCDEENQIFSEMKDERGKSNKFWVEVFFGRKLFLVGGLLDSSEFLVFYVLTGEVKS